MLVKGTHGKEKAKSSADIILSCSFQNILCQGRVYRGNSSVISPDIHPLRLKTSRTARHISAWQKVLTWAAVSVSSVSDNRSCHQVSHQPQVSGSRCMLVRGSSSMEEADPGSISLMFLHPNFGFTVTLFLAIISLHDFAHATTDLLSCYMQNFIDKRLR